MESNNTVYLSKDAVIKGGVLHGGDEAKYDKCYLSIRDGDVEVSYFFNFEPGYSWTEVRMMFGSFASAIHNAITSIWDGRATLHEERAKKVEVEEDE